MELPNIKIGNLKGIRLSKIILEQYNFVKKLELILEEDALILKPIKKLEPFRRKLLKKRQKIQLMKYLYQMYLKRKNGIDKLTLIRSYYSKSSPKNW